MRLHPHFLKFALIFVELVLYTLSASGQVNPFVCTATAVPPLVRAEGLTELVGDIVVLCTGGVPTAIGQPVTPVNLQIFLNANVTSRLIADGGFSEALLLVDDPAPAAQRLCAPGQLIVGTDQGSTTYDGSAANHCNLFQGQASGSTSLVWSGVPLDPPGNGVRGLRITNVRVNAAAVGAGTGLFPNQLNALLSVSPSSAPPVRNPLVVVGFIQSSLSVSVGAARLKICQKPNPDSSNTSLSVAELFPNAFRRRTIAVTSDGNSSPPPAVQNMPGQYVQGYPSETGFYSPAAVGNNSGLADQGTRIDIRFSHVGKGISLRVPLIVPTNASPTDAGLLMRLVSVNAAGAGPFNAVPSDGTMLDGVPATTVSLTGGAAQVVYEVLNSDATQFESAAIPVQVGYDPADNIDISLAQAAVGLTPVSTTGFSDKTSAIPRFAVASTTGDFYAITECMCTLLFPYVTNQGGYDTGVVVANTTRDPFGTAPEKGSVKLTFFGTMTGGDPAATIVKTQISQVVPGGNLLAFTLAGGGNYGVLPVPDFQGYLIAEANFRYCHGYALVIGSGGSTAAGYLGLVMDSPDPSNLRTNTKGEALVR